MKFTPKLVFQAAAAALLASAGAAPAAGQGPPTSPAAAAIREARERERVFQERLQALHEVEEMARETPPGREEPRLALLQIAEDFRLLQVAANGLVEAAPGAGALDLKLVAKSAAEIRKRAARLGSGLALPRPEKGEKRPEPIADEEGLRRSLVALHGLVYEFAHNPVFTQPHVVDAELSLKAQRDLDGIVELSGLVKKGCEALGKGGRK